MENPEKMENMEYIDQMTKNTLFMVKKSLFVTQNALFVNQMTKKLLFYGIYGNNWKITTNALGEHDWVTSKSSKM